MAVKVTQEDLKKKFSELQNVLKTLKSSSGKDLYVHLQEVFRVLILNYPDQALEKLEEVSYLLKKNDQQIFEKFLRVTDLQSFKEFSKQMETYNKAIGEAFGKKKPPVEGEEEEEVAEAAPVNFVPDLLEEAQIYQWAGIGFGQQELYRLQKSMKKLAAESGASKLRFFGVIRGTQKDYYVAEGELEGGEEEGGEEGEKPADFEPKGTGVNKYTYWVSVQTYGPWQKLPDLAPKDIDAARKIKVMFTGDLNRAIYTNPYFFGKEKHYLRAQIARISHSTTLCPKGQYRMVEDSTTEIEENTPEEGEIVMPTTQQMSSSDMWVHHSVGILKCSRTTHQEPVPPEGSEEEPEEMLKKIIALDPYEKRLKPINDDNQVVVSKNRKVSSWVVKMMGDSGVYGTESKKTICHGVIVVRSLKWPGSFNFYYQGRYFTIYVGNGHKYEETSYYPIHPPTVQDDPEEYADHFEPNPLNEPKAPEEKPEGEGQPVEGEAEEAD